MSSDSAFIRVFFVIAVLVALIQSSFIDIEKKKKRAKSMHADCRYCDLEECKQFCYAIKHGLTGNLTGSLCASKKEIIMMVNGSLFSNVTTHACQMSVKNAEDYVCWCRKKTTEELLHEIRIWRYQSVIWLQDITSGSIRSAPLPSSLLHVSSAFGPLIWAAKLFSKSFNI